MIVKGIENYIKKMPQILWLFCIFVISCNTTKHVKEGAHLLRSNTLKIKSDKTITNKGIFKDQLGVLVIQKPNTYWSGIFPFKLWKYNLRSKKYINDPNLELPKSLERPVAYDSILQKRTTNNLSKYLFNQGYFNAIITDTVKFTKKRAYVTYNVTTGLNYLIDKVFVDTDDSSIAPALNLKVADIITKSMVASRFTKEKPYTKPLADEERSRLINLMQNNGFYKFSQDNVSFELDTVNKEKFRDAESLFESAVNFITLQKRKKKNTLNIKTTIRTNGDTTVYQQCKIGKMIVFPDFKDRSIESDSGMIVREIDGVVYRFNKDYIRAGILHKQILIRPGDMYSRRDHELTINKLNELGVFQMVNIYFVEDTINRKEHLLNCYVALSPSKKLDATASLQVASSTTYSLGNSAGVSYRDKNFFRGANMFSISAIGSLELGYDEKVGLSFADHLKLQSTNIGVNSTLIFPKFLSPYKPKWIDNKNLPKTQLSFGINSLNRIGKFQITNISSMFSYNWPQNNTQSWSFAPAFANIVLPNIKPEFQSTLDSNEFLRNSYRRTLIEGENLTYTFTDQEKKLNRNYSYLKVGIEEAGLLLSGINAIHKSISKSQGFIYHQYVKLDLDARKYFNARHSLLALRFLAGIGSPYGDSRTLPYIKQYFVGGPYSIRGWRPRTLGPFPLKDTNAATIDLTGDIKLEMSAEYRFDMIQLFSGTLNLNGALFADAGNTWLAKPDDNYLYGGQFDISRFGQDIAMSTGAGLRVIVAGFFTVRLDAAFPIKDPYKNKGWIVKQLDFGNSEWRRKNVVLNVAIGMPF